MVMSTPRSLPRTTLCWMSTSCTLAWTTSCAKAGEVASTKRHVAMAMNFMGILLLERTSCCILSPRPLPFDRDVDVPDLPDRDRDDLPVVSLVPDLGSKEMFVHSEPLV